MLLKLSHRQEHRKNATLGREHFLKIMYWYSAIEIDFAMLKKYVETLAPSSLTIVLHKSVKLFLHSFACDKNMCIIRWLCELTVNILKKVLNRMLRRYSGNGI
jgi:hypothetical protein